MILIYKENGQINITCEDISFNGEEHLLDFLNNSKITISKYYKDNLYLEVNSVDVEFRGYSKFLGEPIFYDLNRKVRALTLKKERKMKLIKARHKFIRKTATNLTAVVLGSIIVSKLLVPSAKVSEEEIVQKMESFDAPKIEVVYVEEKINNDILKYATLFNISYESAYNFLKLRGVNINNPEEVLNTLYEYSNSISKSPNNLTKEEAESLILKYADILGITDTDILVTMLAVFRLETDHGKSDVFINNNNFGGHRSYDKETKDYYFRDYKNVEIGAFMHVKVFMDIYKYSMTREDYNPLESIEFNMNPTYCGEDWWYMSVGDLKKEVLLDYENRFKMMR